MSAVPKPAEPSMEEILASIRRIIADEQTAPRGERRAREMPEEAAEAGGEPPEPEAELAARPAPPPLVEASPRDTPPVRTAPAYGSIPAPVVSLQREFRMPRVTEPPPVPAAEESADAADAEAPPEAAMPPIAPVPPPVVTPPRAQRREETEAAEMTDSIEAVPPPRPHVIRSEQLREPAPRADLAPPRPRLSPVPREAPAEPAVLPLAADEPLLSQVVDEQVGRAFGHLTETVTGANARSMEDLVREMLRPMLKVWLDDNLPTIVERLVRAEIERVARGR